MSGRAAVAAAVTAIGVGLVACLDLFHSTDDVRTACEIDGATPGCSDAGPTDFCAWTPDKARRAARHACAWLGACETPMGRNAFGACMFQALLAYDCAANPNHQARGKPRALWDCLWQVSSCADVDACIFPDGPAVCDAPGGYTACLGDGGDTASRDVRIECAAGGPQPEPPAGAGSQQPARAGGENCALWGQTCAASADSGACGGDSIAGCTRSGCFSPRTTLHWCADGGDIGLDCAGNGAQACEGFPPGANPASWVACAAQSDSGSCTPDASAACVGGVAYSCPSGVLERVDCDAILQTEGSCTAGPLTPAFDWTAACAPAAAQCTGDACVDGGVSACERGVSFGVDCLAEGLAGCRMVTTDTGAAQHAACTPP
ncbi:MAG TPA: hypothetical protein VE987_11040 [Polyangiaceae bacterium]|nr:hypothetical protein [Polyangiaceae bacterium]